MFAHIGIWILQRYHRLVSVVACAIFPSTSKDGDRCGLDQLLYPDSAQGDHQHSESKFEQVTHSQVPSSKKYSVPSKQQRRT